MHLLFFWVFIFIFAHHLNKSENMTEPEIAKLHNELYDYLKQIHEKDPDFRFRLRRINNQNRLNKGYWFNGNDRYLETSFWDYTDNLHATPVIRLVCHFEKNKKKWSCQFVGRDSKERAAYFKKMATTLGDFSTDEEDRMPVWKKELKNAFTHFLKPLEKFIETDKKRIDAFLNQNKKESLVRFIDRNVFKKELAQIENLKKNRFQQDNTPFNKAVPLPFALSSLDVSNYQGIQSLTIGLGNEVEIPINTQWIFLTGENGFGKTALLRAIAIGLTDDENKILKENETITVIGSKKGQEHSNLAEDKQDVELDFKQVVAYGVSRFSREETTRKESARTASLFSDKELLMDIEDKLLKNQKRFEEIKGKLLQMIPNLANIEKVQQENGDAQIIFKEKDEQGNVFKESVTLEQLAAGYRSIFMMMGDMMIRLSNHLEKSLDEISGIVLIDEIDAHLHPKYQYELPKLLSEAFPKVQFIVTTHSPIPILGLPETVSSVVFKVNRTAEEGISVKRLDNEIEIRRLSANAQLTSDVFGFDTIFARGSTPDTIEPFDNYRQIKEMSEIEKSLTLKAGFKKLRIKI
jgi:predicted ATP-binding protein involved in virulence